MYREVAHLGAFTRRGSSEPQWHFAPPPVTLAAVRFLGKTHMVQWTSEQVARFNDSSLEVQHAMLNKEYHYWFHPKPEGEPNDGEE